MPLMMCPRVEREQQPFFSCCWVTTGRWWTSVTVCQLAVWAFLLPEQLDRQCVREPHTWFMYCYSFYFVLQHRVHLLHLAASCFCCQLWDHLGFKCRHVLSIVSFNLRTETLLHEAFFNWYTQPTSTETNICGNVSASSLWHKWKLWRS